jgi:hypothetical protein
LECTASFVNRIPGLEYLISRVDGIWNLTLPVKFVNGFLDLKYHVYLGNVITNLEYNILSAVF